MRAKRNSYDWVLIAHLILQPFETAHCVQFSMRTCAFGNAGPAGTCSAISDLVGELQFLVFPKARRPLMKLSWSKLPSNKCTQNQWSIFKIVVLSYQLPSTSLWNMSPNYIRSYVSVRVRCAFLKAAKLAGFAASWISRSQWGDRQNHALSFSFYWVLVVILEQISSEEKPWENRSPIYMEEILGVGILPWFLKALLSKSYGILWYLWRGNLQGNRLASHGSL